MTSQTKAHHPTLCHSSVIIDQMLLERVVLRLLFLTAALWRQSKPLLHHNGPAQQFAIHRICDCIIVKCHSELIWDLSLCNAAIQTQSTMCLVFRCAWMRFWYFVCLLCWVKNWFCLFQQAIAVIFQHFAITVHNSSQNACSIM